MGFPLLQSQIEDLQSQHKAEIARLQKQHVDDLDNQIIRLEAKAQRQVIYIHLRTCYHYTR